MQLCPNYISGSSDSFKLGKVNHTRGNEYSFGLWNHSVLVKWPHLHTSHAMYFGCPSKRICSWLWRQIQWNETAVPHSHSLWSLSGAMKQTQNIPRGYRSKCHFQVYMCVFEYDTIWIIQAIHVPQDIYENHDIKKYYSALNSYIERK